jgi:periplasmic divalent cation tolerance protein
MVLTTTPQRGDAERIAQVLVERGLVACAQISGPITSIYRWEGALETAQEWRCLAKTDRTKYEAVEQNVRRLHPYDVPEIVATPIVAGSQAYLDWLQSVLA